MLPVAITRIYRIPPGATRVNRWWLGVSLVASAILWGLFWYRPAAPHGDHVATTGLRLIFEFACIMSTASVLGVLSLTVWQSTTVTLQPHGIAVREYGRTRRVRMDDIAGYRKGRRGNIPTIELVARSQPGKTVEIPPYVRLDESFHRWLRSLPDLDG